MSTPALISVQHVKRRLVNYKPSVYCLRLLFQRRLSLFGSGSWIIMVCGLKQSSGSNISHKYHEMKSILNINFNFL